MKSLFITGGSRGIGAACVKEMMARDYKVAFTYCENREKAEILASGYDSRQCIAVKCDVGDSESVKEAVSEGTRRLGIDGFDGLISCAAISHIELFQQSKQAHWEELFKTNVTGTAAVLWEIMPYMIQEKRGSAVLLSSMWGQAGASCEVGYSATKGAVDAMVRSLAKELGPSCIRVNAVSPGIIDTDMNRDLEPDIRKELAEEVPLGRFGRAEEVAKVVAFLISDDASYVNGQVIGVNGGVR